MSVERIAHAAEARRLAEMADFTYGQIEVRNGAMAVAQTVEAQTLAVTAQVHATLALVEQQRIANLIALGSYRVGANDYPALRHLVIEPVNDFEVAPVQQIREGLGL